MSQSIRDAVEETENIIGSVEYYEKDKPEYVKALRTLLSLAERYLAIEGWPDIEALSELVHKAYCKSYKIKHGKDYWTGGDYNKLTEEDKNYDRATVKVVIGLCKLAHLKEKERLLERLSIEKIESIIEKVMFAHHSDITMTDDANIHEAATALRKMIEEEK